MYEEILRRKSGKIQQFGKLPQKIERKRYRRKVKCRIKKSIVKKKLEGKAANKQKGY